MTFQGQFITEYCGRYPVYLEEAGKLRANKLDSHLKSVSFLYDYIDGHKLPEFAPKHGLGKRYFFLIILTLF